MKISILIPCYNGQEFITRCLDSCLNQTYKDLEIVVVNDGSTDNSLNILKSYQKKNKNIRIINQENKGLAETRNVLLKNANTKYGYFLDVDDWIDPFCIEKMSNLIKDNDLVLNSCLINKKGKDKPFYITNKITSNMTNEEYLINNTPFAWNILFNIEYIKKNNLFFDGNNSFFEDAGVVSFWIYNTKRIGFLNEPMYHYYINKNSLSHNKISNKKIESAINQLKHFYSLIHKVNKHELAKCLNDQLCLYHCIIFSYIQFQSNLNKQEKKNFKRELKELEIKNWKLHFPKRYWKFWYFILYRLFNY